jgi:hypothetical protein
MSMSESIKLTRVERLRQEIEEKKARLATLQARDQKVERGRETKRKLIVGGALISLARKDPFGPVARAIQVAIAGLERPGDQAAFANWSLSSQAAEQREPNGHLSGFDEPLPEIVLSPFSDPTSR